MRPLPSFFLVTSPQELVKLFKNPIEASCIFYNTFESTLLYGVPLWIKAIQQEENPSLIFALNIHKYPGYFFAGLRLRLRYFICHNDLKNKEKLQEFAQQKNGNLWIWPQSLV